MPVLYSASKRGPEALPLNGTMSFARKISFTDLGRESQVQPRFLGQLVIDACVALALGLDAIKSLLLGGDASATLDVEEECQ